jgi:arginase
MLSIIFFQNGLGQKRTGMEKTVKELYKYYKKNKFSKNNFSNVFFIPDKQDLFKNLNTLHKVNKYLLNKTKYPIINIGGDHSMAISTISTSLNKFDKKLKVIWIDAHADINTRSSSPSGNFHGMPLSFLTGLDKLDNFSYIKKHLSMDNLCYIGIRDLDNEEINLIKNNNIKTIQSEDFNSNIHNVINDIEKWIGDDNIHLSIDVDSLDPKYIQYTGTIAPNGLELEKLLLFVENLCKTKNIVNVDLTELNLYNPDLNDLNDLELKKKSKKNFNLLLKKITLSLRKNI